MMRIPSPIHFGNQRLSVNMTDETAQTIRREAAIGNTTITNFIQDAVRTQGMVNESLRQGRSGVVSLWDKGRSLQYGTLIKDMNLAKYTGQ